MIYLVDRYGDHSSTTWIRSEPRYLVRADDAGLLYIDHITHNVHRGRMDHWARFYEKLFDFREIRYFDIHGQKTGLRSRALASPCGKIRIPINEPTDPGSQVEEYLDAYHGEGIQHIALATDDIYETVERLRERGVKFMHTPRTYYDALDSRVPGHGEDSSASRATASSSTARPGGCCSRFSPRTVIGPIFFK